ncbi:hypothetical protein Bca4012_005122 [Brassica carinata]|uniref:(rape) hypothetical protein n=1 Tax=Brassica napus TaxID=3708 RepID=A0A816IH79_BRANA|nr:F-box protein At2g35280-like [Brassica napus]CAF1706397.1 unnamed protein product [Brassica napus]
MTSQLRASARLANKPKHNSVYLKKLKNASEFSISDVIACVYAPDVFFAQKTYNTIFKKSRIRHLTRSPLLTLRCYTQEMEACLKAGNAEAHFIEEVKQYFALDQPKKGLKHLKFSAKNNHDLGTYFYANLLMITGEHEEGMTFMDLFNWRTNMLSVD